ncbi:MAG: hypothetical protein HRU07_00165 [Nitrosopumilus sp.]|nr:hypothetical protein [Nitrosopumilus sp.]NRA04595.1 hypothetical protein [Nitrosopumilus sp.]
MTNYEFDNNISDKEFANRLTKCLILFSDILPIYSKEHQAAFRLIFDADMSEMIPKFLYDLSIQCSKTREQSTPYLIFLKQSLDHTLGFTDKMPEVDYPQAEIEKLVNKRIAGLNLDDVTPHVIKESE